MKRKFIESLIEITRSKTLRLIKILLVKNKFMNLSQIGKFDTRNNQILKEDMLMLVELGLVEIKKKVSLVGKNKAESYYTNYKIKKAHPIIKRLMETIDDVQRKG